jgi:hypothetical protein
MATRGPSEASITVMENDMLTEFKIFSADFRCIGATWARNAVEALRQAQAVFNRLVSVQPEPRDEQYEAWKRLNGF